MTQASATRIHTDPDNMIPKALIRGVLALIAAVMGIAIFATLTDRPLEATPPISEIVIERQLILGGGEDMTGAVKVLDINGTLIADLSAQEGGFVAGVHRVILRERSKSRVAADGPVLLRAHKNGRLAIFDPSTGWGADLMGFGATNHKAFAKLLK